MNSETNGAAEAEGCSARRSSDVPRFMDRLRGMEMGCGPVWVDAGDRTDRKHEANEKDDHIHGVWGGLFEGGIPNAQNAGRLSKNLLSQIGLRVNHELSFHLLISASNPEPGPVLSAPPGNTI